MTAIEQIQAFLRETERISVRGAGTKTALVSDGTALDMTALSGIIEYQPDEYTFTAYAGTPVREIQAALRENQQYLPCDPLLVDAGATLGGTIAANLSGSRRFRYGGVRDFLLGVTIISGMGRLFRGGGKVVKNSAGFDLAKFYVGSLGQYGILTEATFKVFPEPPDALTYRAKYPTLDDALNAVFWLNQQPFELDALDIEWHNSDWSLLMRFAGTADALPARVDRLSDVLHKHTNPHDVTAEDDAIWQRINGFSWAMEKRHVVKVPIAPRLIPALDAPFGDALRRYSVGGNIAWIATDDLAALNTLLSEHNLTGLHILGEPQGSAIMGKPLEAIFADKVRDVLDPERKFV